MMIEQQVISDLAIPPGEYLEEVLEELGLNQADLARRMGRPSQAINEIIKGEKAITPETSIQLEKVLGVPAYIWAGLESEYRLIKASQAESEKAKEEEALLQNFPYLELSKLGLVDKSRDALTKVQNLRRFFGVASLFNLSGIKEYSPAFRQTANDGMSHEALASWLRAGHVVAEKIECENYSREKLLSKLPDIRRLTMESSVNTFFSELKSILTSCGVALVVIPHFKKTYTTGATFWLKKEKAVVMMSLRGSWADIFWFSLFHELGHVLLHGRRITFLENGASDPAWKKQEGEADKFAQETLIPPKEFEDFKDRYDFTASSIRTFAESIGIAPGIVTGRLLHENVLPYTSNFWRNRYKWG